MKYKTKTKTSPALYSRGQLKIQEMAFVLVAIVIFMVIAGLFFIKIQMAGLKDEVVSQNDDKAISLALKIASLPEFLWSSKNNQCDNCVDLDKVFLLKSSAQTNKIYSQFWTKDITAIKFEVLYPKKEGECTKGNYPNCKTITLLNSSSEYSFKSAYVSLCKIDLEGSRKCELGKIYVSAKQF